MRQPQLVSALFGVGLMAVGIMLFWLLGSGLRLSWALPPTFDVHPFERQIVPCDQSLSLEVTGHEFKRDTRAWLMPELTERHAFVATLNTWGSPQQMVIRPPYAYLANNVDGLVVIDIHDATLPVIVASYDLPGQAQALALDFPFLYVAGGNKGLHVLDVSSATAPKHLTTVTTVGAALSLTLAPETRQVFVACGRDGLETFSLRDPVRPVSLGALPFPGLVLDLAMENNRLLAALGQGGIVVLIGRAGELPRELCRLPLAGDARAVAWQRGRPVVASTRMGSRESGMLTLCTLARGPSLMVTASIPFLGAPSDLLVLGDELFVAAARDGVQSFLATEDNLRLLQHYSSIGYIRSLAVLPPYLWLAKGEGEVIALNSVSAPLQLPRLASLPCQSKFPPVVDGNLLAVTSNQNELELYDIAEPAAPQLRARFTSEGRIQVVSLQAGRILVGIAAPPPDHNGLVWVIALDTPVPQLLAEFRVPEVPTALSGAIDWLAVATVDKAAATQHLWFFALDQPQSPPQQFPLARYVSAMARDGSWLYLLDSDSLTAFDLTRPHQPARAGSAEIPWLLNQAHELENFSLLIHRHIAYAASRRSGIKTFALDNPAQPAFLGVIETNDILIHFSRQREHLYLSLSEHGLQIVDIANRDYPEIIGSQPLANKGTFAVASANSLWLGNSSHDRIIAVPLPQPLSCAVDSTASRLHLTIPPQATAGLYGLYFQGDADYIELPGRLLFLPAAESQRD